MPQRIADHGKVAADQEGQMLSFDILRSEAQCHKAEKKGVDIC